MFPFYTKSVIIKYASKATIKVGRTDEMSWWTPITFLREHEGEWWSPNEIAKALKSDIRTTKNRINANRLLPYLYELQGLEA